MNQAKRVLQKERIRKEINQAKRKPRKGKMIKKIYRARREPRKEKNHEKIKGGEYTFLIENEHCSLLKAHYSSLKTYR